VGIKGITVFEKVTCMSSQEWDQFCRNVKKLRQRPKAAASKPEPRISITPREQPPSYPNINHSAPPLCTRAFPQRLRRPAVNARLDLHGYTQTQAQHALLQFLASSRQKGFTWILVITGKGTMNGGTLRTHLPLWLDQLPHLVSGYAQARMEDGGSGAFYVRLKKI
jgi:DNA-nicking Smr family endonuclease